MHRSALAVALLLPVVPCLHSADEPALDTKFTQTVRPFLNQYCIGCHSGSTPAAQFDLKSFTTLSSVVHDLPHWTTLLGRVANKEMPPKGLPQPPDEVRQQVVEWMQAVRMNEARKNAGDPGPVLVRRLSNSEYNNTIRDLTGVDLKPTREFPVDPANTAGFDNSGESLTMSPALLNKYLQAARMVGDHMVLTPDGFDFAPHPMLVETDRDRYAIQRIVNFYESQPTDYADYFQAAWRYKNRAALGKPSATLASIAAESKLSAKYLPMVWQILDGKDNDLGPVAKLRGMFRDLPAPGDDAAVREKCVAMRDFVVRIRKHTAMEFASPIVRGLPAGSQPLLNWKLRQFNSHRRNSDPKALRNDTDPPQDPPTIPRFPGLHQEGAFRAAAVMLKNRLTDNDLVVPAAQHEQYQAAFERLANVFPDNFYIRERGRYFPDDTQDKGRLLSAGYHNVMGYWRDDTPLMELILDEKQQKYLDRLWVEFDYISDHTARTYDQFFFNQSGAVDGKGAESGSPRPENDAVGSTKQIMIMRDRYLAKAKSDDRNDPIAVTAIETHFKWIDDTLRFNEKLRKDAEPLHLQALVKFAAHAYRRSLTPAEREEVLAFYKNLREKGDLSHEDAVRDSIVRILMSPKYLYRTDLIDSTSASAEGARQPGLQFAGQVTRRPAVKAAAGAPASKVVPLSGTALASRLSYFLWSSMPDDELLARAAAGDLRKPDVLVAEARRMLKDEKSSGLALDFGGNWLDFRRFEDHNAVDRERFPSFTNDLREAMFLEPIKFMEDIFRNDRSVLDMLYGKYTFVNPVLAKHYGMPEVTGGPNHWVRVDDAAQYGRGGILPMSVFLTQSSPGLRTSPVKRGYWVVRRVLGEVIPPPPANVPELPQDEAKMDAPLREVLAQHRKNPACASCHARFDSFGLAFEGYGPIGEKREKDLAGHPVESQATFPGGILGSGFEGIEQYIREHREKDFADNLSRKLLAYALGRSLQLSDEPAIETMKAKLAAGNYRFTTLVEAIVTSPQFLNKRRASSPEQKGE